MSSEEINRHLSIVWEVWIAEITSVRLFCALNPINPQMLLAMFAHQRISSYSSLNWHTSLPSPGSLQSPTSSGLQCHCCTSTLLSHPASFPPIVNADSTKLFFSPNSTHIEACTSACRADICSLDACQPHQSLELFSSCRTLPVVEALSFTDNTTPSSAQTRIWVWGHKQCKHLLLLFFTCPNSSRPLYAKLQLNYNSLLAWLPADLYPTSTTHTEGCNLSHVHPRKILPFIPFHWLSGSSYWIQQLSSLLPAFPEVRWPPQPWQDTVAPYLQGWTKNSVQPNMSCPPFFCV